MLLPISLSLALAASPSDRINSTDALFIAQQAMEDGDDETARPLLESFIEQQARNNRDSEGMTTSIDQLGTIQLTKNPSALIAFLQRLNQKRMTLLQREQRNEWLASAREYVKITTSTSGDDETSRFRGATEHYDEAVSGEALNEKAAAKAISYLGAFLAHHQDSPFLDEVYYMLGDLHFRSWRQESTWLAQFYLKLVIRESPDSNVSRKAYQRLDDLVTMRFSGAGKDEVPKPLRTMLTRYKKLSISSS